MGISSFFSNVTFVFTSAVLLRAVLLIYGHFQDTYSPLKYTDIDYYVFTDAARYVWNGQSPYARDTYRYTPLLAWLLVPTAWPGCFVFGKVLFAFGDIVAGWLISRILQSSKNMSSGLAIRFASLWLLNPMVAQISTRGSSEGLLGVIVMALLWAVLEKKFLLAGSILGFAVHFKIYPFIYGASILWWLDWRQASIVQSSYTKWQNTRHFMNRGRRSLVGLSALVFLTLGHLMFYIYGISFLKHTFFYHFTRTDHRHNFSPYNILLYLNGSPAAVSQFHLETLAFIPQLLLSAVVIPIALSKKDLPTCMMAQTFAFVTFNKVCTSQYFLWYMMFLPFYLPDSSLLRKPRLGFTALALWILGQASWLQQGYQLEFLGNSTFVPGLWLTSVFFFGVNIWILGIVIRDVRSGGGSGLSRHVSTDKRS